MKPDEDLPRGKGDFDFYHPPAHYYVGSKPKVEHIEDPVADWTSRYEELGDKMADHSDEQEYEVTDTN